MKHFLPVVVIVGRPNVGKSTFFNRLIGRRQAVVEDTPGITRDRLYAEATWNGKTFTLVDTGGIVFGEDDPLAVQIRVQANVALAEGDVVMFLTDGISGLNRDDYELARALRGIQKPVLLVVNKTDNPQREQSATEFYSLGIGEELFPVSAVHGRGIADLLDRAVELLPEVASANDTRDEIRVAIVGRPNVGKSSMVNAFTGEQRMIVSDIAGTTRDAIDSEIEYKNERFRLIDTAGIRRRGKIQGTVEYYMVDRAQKAIDRAECAVVIVDGQEGLTDGDKRIAKLAHDSGKACIFAINKWDLMEPPYGDTHKMTLLKKDFIRILRDETPELAYAPIVFTSAMEGKGLEPVLELVKSSVENYSFRVSTGVLNRLISDATYARPYSRNGQRLKIYYGTQVTTCPPSFALFCNDPELMHFSYQRYLLNKIREKYTLEGTPIRIMVRASHKDKGTELEGSTKRKTAHGKPSKYRTTPLGKNAPAGTGRTRASKLNKTEAVTDAPSDEK